MKDLPVYLNDHLAGSIGALEMVDDLIETHEGKPLEKFLKAFRDDIEADQRELKQIMEQLGIDESGTRKAGLGRRKSLEGEAAGRRLRRSEFGVTTITGKSLPRHRREALALAHARCGAWIRRKLEGG